MMALVAMCEHIVHCNAPAEISHPQQCEFRIVSGMALATVIVALFLTAKRWHVLAWDANPR